MADTLTNEQAREILGLGSEETVEDEGTDETDETTAEDETPDVFGLPSFTFEDDEEDDPELSLEDEDEEEPEDEDDDDLQKQLRKAQKERDFYKTQRLKEGRKSWEAEAKEHYPLSAPLLATIKAESKREFIARAKEIHKAYVPFVNETVVEPARAAIEKEKADARAEARAAAEKAWGKVPGSTVASTDAATIQANVEKARAKKDLAGTFRAMMGGNDAA